MTDRDRIAEDDNLNREALRALMNFRVDREKALIDLLLSDVPIHWRVRHALAGALSGKPITFGSELAFIGTNDTRTKVRAYQTRKERLRIADWVKVYQAQIGSHEKAVLAAAEVQFSCSVQKVEGAITYSNMIDKWILSVQIPGTYYGDWSREDLRERYIGFEATGETLPPNQTME